MRRSRANAPPSSPFRALAHHVANNGAASGGGGGGSNSSSSSGSVSSLLRAFDVESNPARPIRPSPLASSTIPDIPLDLLDRIRSFPLFMSAPEDFVAAIGKHLRPQVHFAHDHILTEGDDAVAMYWLVRGSVAVTSRDGEAVYAELRPGAFFGEIGVIMDVARTANVVARTKCLLVVLKKEALRAELPRYPEMEKAIRQEAEERLAILRKRQQERGAVASYQGVDGNHAHSRAPVPGQVAEGESGMLRQGVVNSKKRKSPSPGVLEDPATGGSALGSGYVNVRTTLKELPLFAELPADALHFLGLSAQPMSYPPFTDIIRQGTPGEDIFFIVKGEAEVIHGPSETSTTTSRPRLRSGQYFGEVASLGLSPGRTATVRSITFVECLMIGGKALQELWRRCPPGFRTQIEDTAKRRHRKPDLNVDVLMQDASSASSASNNGPLTPSKLTAPSLTFTTPSKPSSPIKSDADSRSPTDPDPFLSVDMENLRNRRRSSLAPPLPPSTGISVSSNGPRGRPVDHIAQPSQRPFSAPSSPPHTDWQGPIKKPRIVPRSLSYLKKPVLDDALLVRVFEMLDIAQLLRLRQVCSRWRRLLTDSNRLCQHVDLSPFHRCVSDAVISEILAPFMRHRARSIDISNSFHITDEGFQTLWRQCGRNVTVWRMRSVWEVSASQILEMSEHSKQLEEVDWSNCRKVGDNLLGRVVGWVVPHPPPERSRNVVIAASSVRAPNASKQTQQPQASSSSSSSSSTSNTDGQQSSPHPPPPPPPQQPQPGTIIGCPKLSRLNLSYCKHITDRSMAHLAAHASSRLQSLSLTRCTSITDAGFQAWTPFHFPRLTHLCLADCTYLSDKAIVSLVNSAKNLTHLDLSFCCALSDTATEVVALSLPKLQELRLAFCGSAVSDASLGGIALHLNDLRGLSVRGCVRVTGVGVENVLEGCGRIEWIDVSQCKNLAGWLGGGGVSRWGFDDKRGLLSGGGDAREGTSVGSRSVVVDRAKVQVVGRAMSSNSKPPTAAVKNFGIGRLGGPGPMLKPVVLPRGVRPRRTRKPVKFILEKDGGLR